RQRYTQAPPKTFAGTRTHHSVAVCRAPGPVGGTPIGATESVASFELHRSGLEIAEDRRDFTDHASKACTLPPKAPVKIGGALVRSEDFNDRGLLLQEPIAVGMALVRPVSQKPGTHRGLAPEQPPVLKAGYVIIVGVRTPDLGVSPVLSSFAHPAVNLASLRAASSRHAPGCAVHFACVW